MTMDRFDNLTHIAIETEKLIRKFGRRKDIAITYGCLMPDVIESFTDWERKYFSLITGEEYFFIWETSLQDIANRNGLLYAVNVTADSELTAASELMNLVSKKF